MINDSKIIENIHEFEMAAERAKRFGFDYISIKPFLTRSPINHAEVLGNKGVSNFDVALKRIRDSIESSRQYETDGFKIVESTNLRVVESGEIEQYFQQPKTCHMQFFRQVLSPLGIFNCPVYRHRKDAQMGENHDYESEAQFKTTLENTEKLLDGFNATKECKEVTCLYNDVNWWLEDLVEHPDKLDNLKSSEDRKDYFL
jgi:hypothetical protein